MPEWSFLTIHARVLICIARDPNMRLRDVAVTVGITERTAFKVVVDPTEAGYVVKERDGRRNRYRVEAQMPLGEPAAGERTVGELLDLLVGPRS
jgi:DNA-binding IclR family transcriptional regulator